MCPLWVRMACSLLCVCTSLPQFAFAISVGDLDTFSTDLEGWQQGHAPAGLIGATRATTGGPLGADDPFLRVQSDSSGSNGKIVVFNTSSSWLGDYVANHVDAISMDVNNLGSTELQLRLAFGTSGAPNLGGRWLASRTSIKLPAGSGWTKIEFPITSADLQGVQGVNTTFDAVMKSVSGIRILHSLSADNNGSPIVATLGIDNILVKGTVPLFGDYNLDGIVDAADYTTWRDTRGNTGPQLAADGTGPANVPDGVVDDLDYGFWVSHFGDAGTVNAVPEPAFSPCCFCLALALLRTRKAT